MWCSVIPTSWSAGLPPDTQEATVRGGTPAASVTFPFRASASPLDEAVASVFTSRTAFEQRCYGFLYNTVGGDPSQVNLGGLAAKVMGLCEDGDRVRCSSWATALWRTVGNKASPSFPYKGHGPATFHAWCDQVYADQLLLVAPAATSRHFAEQLAPLAPAAAATSRPAAVLAPGGRRQPHAQPRAAAQAVKPRATAPGETSLPPRSAMQASPAVHHDSPPSTLPARPKSVRQRLKVKRVSEQGAAVNSTAGHPPAPARPTATPPAHAEPASPAATLAVHQDSPPVAPPPARAKVVRQRLKVRRISKQEATVNSTADHPLALAMPSATRRAHPEPASPAASLVMHQDSSPVTPPSRAKVVRQRLRVMRTSEREAPADGTALQTLAPAPTAIGPPTGPAVHHDSPPMTPPTRAKVVRQRVQVRRISEQKAIANNTVLHAPAPIRQQLKVVRVLSEASSSGVKASSAGGVEQQQARARPPELRSPMTGHRTHTRSSGIGSGGGADADLASAAAADSAAAEAAEAAEAAAAEVEAEEAADVKEAPAAHVTVAASRRATALTHDAPALGTHGPSSSTPGRKCVCVHRRGQKVCNCLKTRAKV